MGDITTKEMLEGYVNRIAGEISYPDSEDEWWKEWVENNPDEGYTVEDEPFASAYLEDALSLEFTISGNGEYLGGEICVGTGGPGLYINTRQNRVEGYWGGDEAYATYRDNLGIDEWLEGMYDNIR